MKTMDSKALNHLNPQQRAAARTLNGQTLLLAVPGSGKTTTLLAKLEHMITECKVPASSMLVITFSRSAAAEMRDRFMARNGQDAVDGISFLTIHGFCYRVIMWYARWSGHEKPRDEVDNAPLIRRLYSEVYGEAYPNENDIRDFLQQITYIKNRMLTEEQIDELTVGSLHVRDLYDAYTRKMSEMNAMDYDDQLVFAYKLLRNVPAVREHFRQRFRYILVDEAQDTSRLQHEIIRLLAGDDGNLFMVGDEDQSIYGFRAAYPEALTEFTQVYPKATLLRLETNYRSGQKIIEYANRLIQNNRTRIPKEMKAERGDTGEVRILRMPDRSLQYDEILRLIEESPETETAILYRNNDSAIPLVQRLRAAQISYANHGLDPLFFSNRVVQDAKDILTFALHPSDANLFWKIYYKFNYRIPKNAVYDAVHNMDRRLDDPILSALVQSVTMGKRKREELQDLQWQFQVMNRDNNARSAIRALRTSMKYRNEKSEKLFVLEMLAEPGESIPEFIEKLRTLERGIQERQGQNPHANVILSTVHGSKGREYERVILIDAINGILPGEDCDVEEERRIYYVAMTRAKTSLWIFDYIRDYSTFLQECAGTRVVDRRKVLKADRGTTSSMTAAEYRRKESEFVVGATVHAKDGRVGTILSRDEDMIEVDFGQTGRRKFVLSICIEKDSLAVK